MPSFLPHYLLHFEEFHDVDRPSEEVDVLERVLESEGRVQDVEFEGLEAERERRLRLISEAVRDSSFAGRVAEAYQNSCAFCGVQLKLIEAAHILPVAASGSDDTSNGLALCPLHHRAFDRSLVTLTDRYEIIVNNEKLEELEGLGLAGGRESFVHGLLDQIVLPRAETDRPDIDSIEAANELRGWSRRRA